MDWTLVFEVFSNFVFDDLQNPFQRFDFIFCANKCLKLWVFHGLCQLIAWFSLYHIFTKRGLFLNCVNMKGSSPFSLRCQNHVACVWQGGFGYGDEDYMKILIGSQWNAYFFRLCILPSLDMERFQYKKPQSLKLVTLGSS